MVKIKETPFLPFINHMGSTIFHYNTAEQIGSMTMNYGLLVEVALKTAPFRAFTDNKFHDKAY